MNLRAVIHEKPWTLAYAVIFTVWPGPLAMIAGAHVSSAFTVIGAGFLANAMGAGMFLGGAITLAGLVKVNHATEAVGLIVMAMATALYAVGVLLGLGVAGQIAGALAVAASLSMLGAALGISCEARDRAQLTAGVSGTDTT